MITLGVYLVGSGLTALTPRGGEWFIFLYATRVIAGIVEGCAQAGAALVGGETAEMPDFYPPGEYDLAGFIVGAVEEKMRLDPRRVRPGDALIALPSSGLHTNGYSLARKLIFAEAKLKPDTYVAEVSNKIGAELLRPHRPCGPYPPRYRQ